MFDEIIFVGVWRWQIDVVGIDNEAVGIDNEAAGTGDDAVGTVSTESEVVDEISDISGVRICVISVLICKSSDEV